METDQVSKTEEMWKKIDCLCTEPCLTKIGTTFSKKFQLNRIILSCKNTKQIFCNVKEFKKSLGLVPAAWNRLFGPENIAF